MFLQFFIWGSWFVTTGTYLLQTLEFTGREVGLVYGTAAISATLSPFILGVLADRLFAAEKLLAILHIVGGGLMWYLATVTSFAEFYLIVLLYMLCYVPTFSLANALSFHHIKDIKKDFPKVRVWGTVSWIMVGFLLSYLNVEDQVLPLQIAAVSSVIQGFYCFTLPHTPPNKGTNIFKALMGPEIRTLFKDRSFMVMIISIALICIPTAYYYSFVNPFLNEVGVDNAAGKMAIGQGSEILFMLILPWAFRFIRLKYIIFAGLLAWGLRYGCFMIGLDAAGEFWYMLCLIVHGLAFVFGMLSAQIYLDTRVPDHLRSTAQGFYSLLTLGIGALIGAFIAGETVTSFTLENGMRDWWSIWAIPTVIGTAVAIGFFIFFRSKEKG